jgi:hypothetical protein
MSVMSADEDWGLASLFRGTESEAGQPGDAVSQESDGDFGLASLFGDGQEEGQLDDGFLRQSARNSGTFVTARSQQPVPGQQPVPDPDDLEEFFEANLSERGSLAGPRVSGQLAPPMLQGPVPRRVERQSAPVPSSGGLLASSVVNPPVVVQQPVIANPPASPHVSGQVAGPLSVRGSQASVGGSAALVQAPPVQAPPVQAPAQPPVQAAQVPPAKRNLAPTKGWRLDGQGTSGGRLGVAAEGLDVASEGLEVVENGAELVNTGATSAMGLLDATGALGQLTSNVEGALRTGEAIGGVAEQVGDYINPIKGFAGAPVETNNLVKTAAELVKIRKFQRNEGKTLAGSTDARVIDQESDREAIKATKQNLADRERAQARQRGAIAVKNAVEARNLDQGVQDEAAAELSSANRARWKAWGSAAKNQVRLKAIAKDAGYRMENESSMEQSAYTQDKKFIKRAPVGMDAADIGRGIRSAFGAEDSRAPKVGMLEKDADGRIALGANGMPKRSKGTALDASSLPATAENRMENLSAADLPTQAAAPGEGVFRDRRSGYRPATDAGRAKQGQVKAARFIQGAGQLLEGTLDTDRMINDGEYGKAYAAKVADLGVNVATTAGADALTAAAPALGPIAAPAIGVAGAVKETVGHVKDEFGRVVRGAGQGLESLVDPEGLAKEQDLKDHRNKWLGYQDPQPPAQAAGGGAGAGAAPIGPVKGMSRAERAAVYGVDFKEQGDESVVGQRKRTWGRAIFDNTLGLAGKAITGTARAAYGVGKGLWQGAKWAGGKVASGVKSLGKRLRGERSGDMARRDLELLRKYRDVPDGEMPAEGAFKDKLGMLGAEDAKYDREWSALSAADRKEYSELENRHKRIYGIGANRERVDAQGNRIVGDREKLLASMAAKAPSQADAEAANVEKDQLQELHELAANGDGQDQQDALEQLIAKLEDEALKKQQAAARAGTGVSNPGP